MIGKKYVKTTMVTLEAIAVFLSIFSTFSTAGMYTVSNTQKPFSKLFIEYMTFTVKYMNFIKKKTCEMHIEHLLCLRCGEY